MTWVFEAAVNKHLQRPNKNKPTTSNSVLRLGLYPFLAPESLPNCKRYIFIQPDGSSIESAFLNINDKRDRESVIVFHVISELVRTVGEAPLGLNLIRRDDPWDFTFEFSNGLIRDFEVVSVSDDPQFFELLSREEFMQSAILEGTISRSKLEKLVRDFPDMGRDEKVRAALKSEVADSVFPNPVFGRAPILLSLKPKFPTTIPEEHIIQAIESKERKRHHDKKATILVIDNRFMLADLQLITKRLAAYERRIAASPFPEIWFYTGYGGYSFGQDGEYAVFPLKMENEFCGKYLSAELNTMPWAE